jgi:hypothetical protein
MAIGSSPASLHFVTQPLRAAALSKPANLDEGSKKCGFQGQRERRKEAAWTSSLPLRAASRARVADACTSSRREPQLEK